MEAIAVLRQLVGQRLLGCASSWHEYAGERSDEPSDTWLQFPACTVNLCGGPNGQGITAVFEDVGEPVDMDEYGQVVIEDATPRVLAARVGDVLRGITALGYEPWGDEVVIGLVLHLDGGDVALVNHSDETWIEEWPTRSPKYSLVVTLQG